MDTNSIFLLAVITSSCIGAEYGERIKNYTETWGENLDMQESRHTGYALLPPPRYPTDLPITFQAPYINAKNYWYDSGRRTVFDFNQPNSLDFIPRPISDGLNSFYGMMNHFLGIDGGPPRKPDVPNKQSLIQKQQYLQQQQLLQLQQEHQQKQQQQQQQQQKQLPPFRHNLGDFPFYSNSLQPQYLPGPKPVRATVVKIEHSRPTSAYGPAAFPDFVTTSKTFPQFVKLLNDVLIENAYNNHGFDHVDPVLEKPNHNYESYPPTTFKPKYPFSSRPKPTVPVSIQDQLPPILKGQDTRIPYVTETVHDYRTLKKRPKETTTQQSVKTTETIHKDYESSTSGTPIVFPDSSSTVPPLDYEIDVRNAGQAVINQVSTPSSVIFESTKTTSTEKPTTMSTTTTTTTTTTQAPFFPRGKPPRRKWASTSTTAEIITRPSRVRYTPTTTQTPTTTTTTTTQSNFLNFEAVTTAEESVLQTVTEFNNVPPEMTTVSSTSETSILPDTAVQSSPETTTTYTESATAIPALISEASENEQILAPILHTMESMENVPQRSPFAFPKELADGDDTTEYYVTDLTLRGLKGRTNSSAAPPRDFANMNRVVGYEIDKLNATAPPPTPDFSDELSLDAKILKDTNWDGIQPRIPLTTTESLPISTEPLSVLFFATTMPSPTIMFPTILPQTTSEAITDSPTEAVFTVLPETTTTPPQTERSAEVISTRRTQSVSRGQRARFGSRTRSTTPPETSAQLSLKPPNFDNQFDIGSFISTSTEETDVTTRRHYRRRQKVKSFTPAPKVEEQGSIEFPSLSRPFYPKKSRPNATLTFKRRMLTDSSSEERKPSPRPITGVRRNLYKPRGYPSQLRRSNLSTEEPTVADN